MVIPISRASFADDFWFPILGRTPRAGCRCWDFDADGLCRLYRTAASLVTPGEVEVLLKKLGF